MINLNDVDERMIAVCTIKNVVQELPGTGYEAVTLATGTIGIGRKTPA